MMTLIHADMAVASLSGSTPRKSWQRLLVGLTVQFMRRKLIKAVKGSKLEDHGKGRLCFVVYFPPIPEAAARLFKVHPMYLMAPVFPEMGKLGWHVTAVATVLVPHFEDNPDMYLRVNVVPVVCR